MSILRHGIDGQYFDFSPAAGHLDGCPRHGTDVWEVTRHQYTSYSGDRTEVTIRLACHECGVVHYERADQDLSSETTHASETGYGSRPEKACGLWLWPGPRIWRGDDRGPVCYFVTAAKIRPRRPEDVFGVVAWSAGPRGGVRWSAGLGRTEHGAVLQSAGLYWASRRAAAAWVAGHSQGGAS